MGQVSQRVLATALLTVMAGCATSKTELTPEEQELRAAKVAAARASRQHMAVEQETTPVASYRYRREISMFYSLDLLKDNSQAAAMSAVMRAHDNPVRLCYADRLNTVPSLAGDLALSIQMSKVTGTPNQVSHVGGSLTDPTVINCVIHKLAEIPFHPPYDLQGKLSYRFSSVDRGTGSPGGTESVPPESLSARGAAKARAQAPKAVAAQAAKPAARAQGAAPVPVSVRPEAARATAPVTAPQPRPLTLATANAAGASARSYAAAPAAAGPKPVSTNPAAAKAASNPAATPATPHSVPVNAPSVATAHPDAHAPAKAPLVRYADTGHSGEAPAHVDVTAGVAAAVAAARTANQQPASGHPAAAPSGSRVAALTKTDAVRPPAAAPNAAAKDASTAPTSPAAATAPTDKNAPRRNRVADAPKAQPQSAATKADASDKARPD